MHWKYFNGKRCLEMAGTIAMDLDMASVLIFIFTKVDNKYNYNFYVLSTIFTLPILSMQFCLVLFHEEDVIS